MATSRLASNIDQENLIPTTQHIASKDVGLGSSSSRIHSVKKQAFGELKNLLHNQPQLTPFKAGLPSKLSVFTPSQSTRDKENSGFVKPLAKKSLDLDVHVNVEVAANDDEFDEDDFDFCSSTCSSSCNANLELYWEQQTTAKLELVMNKLSAGWNLYDQQVYDDPYDVSESEHDEYSDILQLSSDDYDYDLLPAEGPLPFLPDQEYCDFWKAF